MSHHRSELLEKLGALSAGLRIQEMSLSKVLVMHYTLTPTAFKDAMLTLGHPYHG